MNNKNLYYKIFKSSCDYTEAMCIYYCAPVIFNLKASGIVTLCRHKASNIEKLKKALLLINLKTFNLCQTNEKIMLMIYSEKLMLKILCSKNAKDVLNKFGYQNLGYDFKKMLVLLKQRYNSYILNKGEYPHEIGIFLNYPPEDVIDFINNKQCKFCGYWKVYNNEEKAKKIFNIYDQVREFAIKELVNGNKIEQIVQKHYLKEA